MFRAALAALVFCGVLPQRDKLAPVVFPTETAITCYAKNVDKFDASDNIKVAEFPYCAALNGFIEIIQDSFFTTTDNIISYRRVFFIAREDFITDGSDNYCFYICIDNYCGSFPKIFKIIRKPNIFIYEYLFFIFYGCSNKGQVLNICINNHFNHVRGFCGNDSIGGFLGRLGRHSGSTIRAPQVINLDNRNSGQDDSSQSEDAGKNSGPPFWTDTQKLVAYFAGWILLGFFIVSILVYWTCDEERSDDNQGGDDERLKD